MHAQDCDELLWKTRHPKDVFAIAGFCLEIEQAKETCVCKHRQGADAWGQ